MHVSSEIGDALIALADNLLIPSPSPSPGDTRDSGSTDLGLQDAVHSDASLLVLTASLA